MQVTFVGVSHFSMPADFLTIESLKLMFYANLNAQSDTQTFVETTRQRLNTKMETSHESEDQLNYE